LAGQAAGGHHGQPELKSAGELMAYFAKVGEGNKAASIDSILGAPTTTLDGWLERRKARHSAAGTAGLGLPRSYA
jgi:hypothetical protein